MKRIVETWSLWELVDNAWVGTRSIANKPAETDTPARDVLIVPSEQWIRSRESSVSQVEGAGMRIDWEQHAAALRRALEAGGVFLLTRAPDGRTNPMTIGWAQVGLIWNRPVCAVFVRKSRYTYECITGAHEFVVSVPLGNGFNDELMVCGSASGREIDKIRKTGIVLAPGRVVDVPVVDGCVLQIECRILARTQMLPGDLLADDVRGAFYPTGDEHLVVFGEIVA
ncbi:flavin reductase family protein, partial [Candidatus Bipolaricaulota bacterium]|nr:flavin reductase family protein [Candidatus Bipolaricaulota bacterium]